MIRRQFLALLSTMPLLSGLFRRPSTDSGIGVGEPHASKGRWFAYCSDTMEEFATRDEAIQRAEEYIEACLDDSWDEDVQNIVVGCITDQATQTNTVEREMLDDEQSYNGRYYPGELDYWCDYEMLPSE